MTKEDGKEIVKQLVKSFDSRNAQIMKQGYLETTVRTEFLDDFYKALGWDIKNRTRIGEVKLESGLSPYGDGRKGRADYEFTLSRGKSFFVEAKKPFEKLETNANHAIQARRYAFSAKHPVVILSDFEEFSVYLGRGVEPKASDGAEVARLDSISCRYTDYMDRWDQIWGYFSRESVRAGALETIPGVSEEVKGERTVDALFLADIETWRKKLAENIYNNNPSISLRSLNEVVQKTIDRIIFLRICEDREIEDYGRIQNLIGNKGIYSALCKLFKKADRRYNSGLFNFGKENGDEFSLSLIIDNEPLQEMIDRLYFPGGPYAFAVMPADILGQVYERFLGKVLEIGTNGVIVEDKPEVKKAGGVFYTPEYIVDYIVKNTVGRLLENKKPKEVAGLKVLDPACGSGAFLINAYQYLLDWHLTIYTSSGKPETWQKKKRLIKDIHGAWRLALAERKRILTSNIFGVDIDPQAVEVTRLSLFLKCLEGETKRSAQLGLFDAHERVLPDLDTNIKCGNSLIGTDFDLREQMLLPVFEMEEALQKINSFDWKSEFADVFMQGGFDAVIGNPPYIQSRSDMFSDTDKQYLNARYQTSEYQLNTYGLFMEKGFNLLKDKAFLGYIIPNYWLSTRYDEKLRDFVFRRNAVDELVNVYKVFESATVDTLLFFGQRTNTARFPKSFCLKSLSRSLSTIGQRLQALQANNWSYRHTCTLETTETPIVVSFLDTLELEGDKTLADYFHFKFGMKPYERGKGDPSQTREMMRAKIYDSKEKRDDTWLPLYKARNVKRYYLDWQGDWIKYGKNLAAPRDLAIFTGPRILLQRIIPSDVISGCFEEETVICNTDVITLKPKSVMPQQDLLFFLGILLSRLCCTWLKSRNVNLDRAAFPKINANTLEAFPVSETDSSIREQISNKVVDMLKLHKVISKAGNKEVFKRQIKATDHRLDALVNELYGLNEKDVLLIERK